MKQRIALPWELAGMPPGTPVLLALSGGADSRYLLEVLLEAAKRDGFPLSAAHVHHGIRGEEADRDLAFCRALAERYRFPLEVHFANVPALAAEQGRGLEEVAREVRYAFFEKVMREKNVPLLATAHQADDLTETLLFRLCRGTGARGLCGIPAVRPFANGYLTRPLLPLTAKEIRASLDARGVAYVTDSTNADATYARNRLRTQVVPALETLFGEPQKRILQTAEALRLDEDYFEKQTDGFFAEHPGETLPCEALLALHPALRVRVLERWVQAKGGSAGAVHLHALEALAAKENGRSLDLPGLRVMKHRGALAAAPDPGRRGKRRVSYRVPFAEGIVPIPGTAWKIRVEKCAEGAPKETKIHNLSIVDDIFLPAQSAIIEQTLHWRPAEVGEALPRGGMHRRLRELWREAGVPAPFRSSLPLLADAEGALWVPRVGLREGVSRAVGSAGYRVTLFSESQETEKEGN